MLSNSAARVDVRRRGIIRSSKEPRRSLPAPRRSTRGLVCALLVHRTPHVLTVAVTCVVLDAVRTWHELCENIKSLGWLHIAILLLFPSFLSFSLLLFLFLSLSLSFIIIIVVRVAHVSYWCRLLVSRRIHFAYSCPFPACFLRNAFGVERYSTQVLPFCCMCHPLTVTRHGLSQ